MHMMSHNRINHYVVVGGGEQCVATVWGPLGPMSFQGKRESKSGKG